MLRLGSTVRFALFSLPNIMPTYAGSIKAADFLGTQSQFQNENGKAIQVRTSES